MRGPIFGRADEDWAGDPVERKSTSGKSVLLKASKKKCVTLSSTEAEHVALSDCAKAVIWLLDLLGDLGHNDTDSTAINEDNTSAIKWASNSTPSSKHVGVRQKNFHELVSFGELKVLYCPMENSLQTYSRRLSQLHSTCASENSWE